MIIHDVKQGTPEWDDLKRGKFTASPMSKLFMGKTTQGYNDLIYKVAMERVTGKTVRGFNNHWMERGVGVEPMARQAYEVEKEVLVEECGFIEVDEWLGCSPDGLVGDDGMIQIKCPAFNTHIGYIVENKVPKDYYVQMQTELYVSGRKWNDFVSFHPELPMLILRVEPDKEMFKKIAEEVELAKQKVEETIKKIEACRR